MLGELRDLLWLVNYKCKQHVTSLQKHVFSWPHSAFPDSPGMYVGASGSLGHSEMGDFPKHL